MNYNKINLMLVLIKLIFYSTTFNLINIIYYKIVLIKVKISKKNNQNSYF